MPTDSVSVKILSPVTNVKIVLLNITTLPIAAILVIVMRTAQWTKIAIPVENVPARKTLLETSAIKLLKHSMTSLIQKNVIAMLKVPKEMLVMKKEDVLAVVTSKETNVMNVIQNTTGSQLVTLVCVTSMVPLMIYAMPQQANVLARTVLQMINAANALKVSLDIQIVKDVPAMLEDLKILPVTLLENVLAKPMLSEEIVTVVKRDIMAFLIVKLANVIRMDQRMVIVLLMGNVLAKKTLLELNAINAKKAIL